MTNDSEFSLNGELAHYSKMSTVFNLGGINQLSPMPPVPGSKVVFNGIKTIKTLLKVNP